MVWVQPFCWIVVVLLVWSLGWRVLNSEARFTLSFFTACYALTSFIGGFLIGITQGAVLEDYWGSGFIGIPNFPDIEGRYWTVLFAPLVLPTFVAMLFGGRRAAAQEEADSPRISLGVQRVPFLLVFFGTVAFVLVRVVMEGHASLYLGSLFDWVGDSVQIVRNRYTLFASFGTVFFALIYTMLPALSHLARFAARRDPRWRWTVWICCATVILLSLATFQVAVPLLYVVMLAVTQENFSFSRNRLLRLGLAGLGLILIVVLLHWGKYGELSVDESLAHVVLRMPASLPYYIQIYPEYEPHLGVDWLGTLTGWGTQDPAVAFSVARFMFREMDDAGAQPAPSHVHAYAEGGVGYALAMCVIMGLMIVMVSRLRRTARKGPFHFAFWVQSLVALYYMTQISLRGVFWMSYGFVWSAVALLAMAAVSVVMPKPASRIPDVQPSVGTR